ncbi:MAG: TIGR03792 family protein [Nanoarchaeota archaeon]
MELNKYEKPWVIEQLKFEVNPDKIEEFIEKDHEVWTKALSSCPGFIKKEVWVSDNDKGVIITTVYWESREDWKSINEEFLSKTDKEFYESFGQENIYSFEELHAEKHFKKVAEFGVGNNE